jgi:polyferredoxin
VSRPESRLQSSLRAAFRLLPAWAPRWPSRSLPGRAARAAVRGLSAAAALTAGIAAAQPGDDEDLWGFDDLDDADPSLLELASDQALDIGLFAAFAVLAMYGFSRRSVPLKYATLVASVLYLGVYKSQLLSIVNVFGALTANLPIFSYSMAWYAFAIFAVATTVLWGRLYCGRICAFGALTQLIDAVVPSRWRVEIPPRLERRAGYIKYGILFGAVGYYLVTREIGFYRYIEPFWMFTFQASTPLWIGLGVLLVASVFVRNLYCRFLCPLGAALGLLSTLSVFRIKRWSECSQCKLCENACQWGAIRQRKILVTECVRCDDCELLYADQQSCPHWLLEHKRKVLAEAERLAAASPRPAAPAPRSAAAPQGPPA